MIILIFFIALFLRLAFLSPWLEDWDSVQFALALHDFDIAKHQPHPPGYPLYVMLGRILNFFLQNDRLSLTFLSALFGALTIIPLYLLVQKMLDKKTAALASVFFAATPIAWMMSEVALTNIVGLFFLTLLAYLIYIWRKRPKKLVFASFFAGFILGFRFTELPIISALLALVYLKLGRRKYIFLGILAFLAGTVLWVAPILFDTGLKNFLAEYFWIANYVLRHDALQGSSSFSASLFTERLQGLRHILMLGYTPYFLLLSALSLFWIYKNRQNWKNFHFQFLFTWLLAYALPSVFFYNLEVPRYTLPYSVPFAILSAYFLANFNRLKSVSAAVFLITSVLLFNQGWSQVTRFKSFTPPTIAPVVYVKENFNPQDTVVLASFTYRQFQYYAPEFRVFYTGEPEKISVEKEKYVIVDHEGIREQFGLETYILERQKEFSGDKDIFSRIPKINLYVLTSQE